MTEVLKPEAEDNATLNAEPQRAAEFALALFDLLGAHRRELVWTVLVAIVVFAGIAFLIPKRYEAVARLMPPDQAGSASAMMSALMSKGGEVLGSAGSDILGLRTQGATIVGVLNSRTIADDLVNQFDLRKVYSKRTYFDAREMLAMRTDIIEDKKSGIITIAVQDRDPQMAAALAHAYVDDLNHRIAQLSTSAARREREFLEQRLQTVKAALDDATLRLSHFSSKNMTFEPEIQGKAMLDAAATLQGQLIEAETELSGLRQIYGPQNSRVIAAGARVGELRSKLRSLSGGNGSTTSGEFGPSLEQLPLLGNTYYDLARQAKIDATVYEILTKQYELAKVEEAKEVPSIRVLDEPVVPEKKYWPPRLMIILCGTLLTFLAAMAYLMARAGLEKLAPEDPRRILVSRFSGSLRSFDFRGRFAK